MLWLADISTICWQLETALEITFTKRKRDVWILAYTVSEGESVDLFLSKYRFYSNNLENSSPHKIFCTLVRQLTSDWKIAGSIPICMCWRTNMSKNFTGQGCFLSLVLNVIHLKTCSNYFLSYFKNVPCSFLAITMWNFQNRRKHVVFLNTVFAEGQLFVRNLPQSCG